MMRSALLRCGEISASFFSHLWSSPCYKQHMIGRLFFCFSA